MRKEIIFAIIVGVLVGTVVTYGVYVANKSLANKIKGVDPKTNTIPIPSSTPEPEVTLTITNPENGLVLTEQEINIEGKTQKDCIVTISSGNEDYIIESDDNGFFSQKINLEKGANTVLVTATNINKISETKTLNIVYSTEIKKDENENKTAE